MNKKIDLTNEEINSLKRILLSNQDELECMAQLEDDDNKKEALEKELKNVRSVLIKIML